MVLYSEVQAENIETFSRLPEGLVAVFVGATNGIGEYTLKQLAKHANKPRVYFIGRSQEAGDRIASECSGLNAQGAFNFIQADTSLIRNVDRICKDIKAKERSINLLFLSTGTLDFYTETTEGLRLAAALVHYTRARFIYNLLPELQAATGLRRVVSVFAGTKEGPLYVDDINGENVPMVKKRGHAASLVTAHMMTLAKQAPTVSFVHTFPGPVKSGIGRDMPGIMGTVVRTVAAVAGPVFNIPTDESGAYHLFFATSDRYCPKQGGKTRESSPEAQIPDSAVGIDDVKGSGMYCVNEKGGGVDLATRELLVRLKEDGSVDKVWQHTVDKWQSILDAVDTKA